MEEKPSHKPPAPPPEMQAVPWDDPLPARLVLRYPTLAAKSYLEQPFLEIEQPHLLDLLEHLHDAETFDFLVDLTAADYPKRERRFELIYLLHSFERNTRIRIKTHLADGDAVESAAGIYPGANWLEREVFDMFGIVFRGHPGLKRILLPEGWEGHPLRKETSILAMDHSWVQANLGIESGQ